MAQSILLVEDNTAARRNIATFLEREGYQVAQETQDKMPFI